MTLSVAIVAPGQMGAAVGRRLRDHGVEVMTCLEGRGEASRRRAESAGMLAVDEQRLAGAELVLSILPPGEAVALAERLAPAMAAAGGHGVYVDCNAVSPRTVKRIGAVLAAAGCAFVDAGIIGGPPRDGAPGPSVYASGEAARRFAVLADRGLDIRILDGPVGAASALKMSYAGITKGIAGLASAMILAASREGAAAALHAELMDSQPELLARFAKTLPGMYPKAYRWVAEMEEIAAFLGEDKAAALMFEGLARLYERLATDVASAKSETGALDAFLARKPG